LTSQMRSSGPWERSRPWKNLRETARVSSWCRSFYFWWSFCFFWSPCIFSSHRIRDGFGLLPLAWVLATIPLEHRHLALWATSKYRATRQKLRDGLGLSPLACVLDAIPLEHRCLALWAKRRCRAICCLELARRVRSWIVSSYGPGWALHCGRVDLRSLRNDTVILRWNRRSRSFDNDSVRDLESR